MFPKISNLLILLICDMKLQRHLGFCFLKNTIIFYLAPVRLLPQENYIAKFHFFVPPIPITNNVYRGFSAALVFLQLMLCQFLEPIVEFEQLKNQDSATSHNNCSSALAEI